MKETVQQVRDRFAFEGAKARVHALKAEIQTIYNSFSDKGSYDWGEEPSATAPSGGKKKGPKGMSLAQRRLVSERMKKYWAGKRKQAKKAASNIG
jgi:hypothetical protein